MTHRRQRGQGMTEFIIVWPVLILLVFGTLQFVLIYLAKSTLNFATFEATRAGTLNQARREQVVYGFVRGMAPMYSTNKQSVNQAREKILEEVADGNVCIERINPRQVDFDEYAESTDRGDAIPNDNLNYRTDTSSGLPIQDANILKIRITYCYELIVPLMDRLIPGLMNLKGSAGTTGDLAGNFSIFRWDEPLSGSIGGSFEEACWDRGRIPIKAQGILRMQSAAINDTSFDTNCD